MNLFVVASLFETLLGLWIDGEPGDKGVVIQILPFVAELKDDLIPVTIVSEKPLNVVLFESGQEFLKVFSFKKQLFCCLELLGTDLRGQGCRGGSRACRVQGEYREQKHNPEVHEHHE